MKWKHIYVCKGDSFPYGTVAFKIEANGQKYGMYFEYNKNNKYRVLRNLVRNKHLLIEALEFERIIND